MLRLERHVRRAQRRLPDLPGPDTPGTVVHAGDAEEAVEVIQAAGREGHARADVVVVAGGVGGGDD